MEGDDGRLFSPSAARNREPILQVLRRMLPVRGLVLEIAGGSGEHVVHFAAGLPGLEFQPTDPDPAAVASIAAWIAHAGLGNVRAPVLFDVRDAAPPVAAADAIVCINMIHIAAPEATPALIGHAAQMLSKGGPLVLYGPFRCAGVATAAGNEEFDASLKQRDPRWGLRWLEDVAAMARDAGFSGPEIVEMPANNLCVAFAKV